MGKLDSSYFRDTATLNGSERERELRLLTRFGLSNNELNCPRMVRPLREKLR